MYGRERARTCRSLGRAAGSAALLLALAGCVLTDEFRGRALEYNDQAADAKRSVILANVLRSAYAMPLQFTDISTVTGQAGAQGGIGASVPFSLRGVPNLLGSVTPSAGISGNSTFGVTNLNTQEFYNGLQTPVSKQLIALYLRSGFPAQILLPLVVSEIEVVNGGRRARLLNDPTNPAGFRNFNSALQVLIAKGLGAEESTTTSQLGPVLTPAQAADARLQAQIVASGTDAPTLQAVGGGYQLRRKTTSASFCFDPLRFNGPGPYADVGALSGPSKVGGTLSIPLVTAGLRDYPDATFLVDSSKFCGNGGRRAAGEDGASKQQVGLNFTFMTRSVEGIFGYLGAIVRREEGLADGRPEPLDLMAFDGTAYRLFRLERRQPTASDLTVAHEGATYALRVDPSGQDGSSRVLRLLTDLLALQSSAKNLPSPSVISVISQ